MSHNSAAMEGEVETSEPIDDITYQDDDSESSEQHSFTATAVAASSIANGISFYFTEQPNSTGWNNNNTSSLNLAQESDDEDEDITLIDYEVGKSYDVFESKLKEGFLEAPNLGLVCVPPAMFDYNPPLQRVDLKDNKIETLPDHFFDELPLLTWCDLRYNRLNSLPPISQKHDCLNVLLLQDNELCELPCTLAYASNLHTLGWTNNHIIDPPRHILLQGCKKTLDYLRSELVQRLPLDGEGNLASLESDNKLLEDLTQTARKSVVPKRSVSRSSLRSDKTNKSADDSKREEMQHKKRIDRIKYTWNLWKDIPYDGVSNHKLFEKSLQEVRNEVRSKLNQDKEAVLQKMKDTDELRKFRMESRMLQMNGPQKPYNGVSMPFGTDADIPRGCSDGERTTPEKFRTTVKDCLKKLQDFAADPAPINDTTKAIERLREVEDIQRKLLDMKVVWSVKSSDPA